MNTTATTYRPVRRPSDVWSSFLLNEFRQLARYPKLLTFELFTDDADTKFRCRPDPNVNSFYFRCCSGGQDYAVLLASVQWLKEGPKIADVSEEQYLALSQVEVRLGVRDFRMPFPTVLVNMPPGMMHRYVIVHRSECVPMDEPESKPIAIIIGAAISEDNTHDIITVIRQKDGEEVEASLGRYYGDVSDVESVATHQSMRVALNMMLAMTNLGCESRYLFPAEVVEQRRHVKNGNRQYKDGTRASDRLAEQPMAVVLDREVKLYHREGAGLAPAGDPTGREMPFHWRRGHWHKVRCGKGKVDTKLCFYPPTMVRADLLQADPTDTTTSYK